MFPFSGNIRPAFGTHKLDQPTPKGLLQIINFPVSTL